MIESLDNKKVKEWAKLNNKKYRKDRFLLTDEDMIKEVYNTGLLNTLIYVKNKPFDFVNSYEVSKNVLNKISKENNGKYIGISNKIKQSHEYKNKVIILDELADPANIGRIIEAAYAYGFDSVILSNNSADLYNEKCLKAAHSALFKINIVISDIKKEITLLKNSGFKIYATALKNYSKNLYDIKPSNKISFIFGNEGSGVKEEYLNISDEIMKIEMNNIDSLNVSMAAAIVMHHFSNN